MRHFGWCSNALWVVTYSLLETQLSWPYSKKTLFARKSLISSLQLLRYQEQELRTVVILLHTWATLASGIHRAATTSSKATIENSTYVSFSISIYMLYVILWKLSNLILYSRKIGSVELFFLLYSLNLKLVR